MAKSLLNSVGEYTPDGLITDTQPPAIVRGVTLNGITAPVSLKRGTLLNGGSNGKVTPATGTLLTDADCILADDVDITKEDGNEVTVAAYYAGCFDPEKILDKDGAPIALTAEALKTLRTKGILFKGTAHILPKEEKE